MRKHFEVGETAVTVISDELFMKTAEEAIFEAREIIISKISEDPFFRTTFEPYPENENDDVLIRMMCRASVAAGVGPMAGVAGAVAYHTVKRMAEAGAQFAIVENGGDIALKIDRDVTVGIFQDDEKFKDLALSVPKRDGIFGICSSSGKIGPSVSFGNSGICTVISEDVILADACATALGNLIGNGDMSSALEKIGSVDGVEGCIATSDGMLAMFGDVPELIKAKFSGDQASSIRF